MELKAQILNKKVSPMVGFEVHRAGKNDYRVVISGIGEYSKHDQFGLAFSKAQWLSLLSQSDLNWEIAKVQAANDKRSA